MLAIKTALCSTHIALTTVLSAIFDLDFQYCAPWKVETYRETTRAIRALGYDIINERVEALKRGEQTHSNDILAHIISQYILHHFL